MRGVVVLGVHTVAIVVVEDAKRRVAQSFLMIRWRMFYPMLHDHAVTVADARVPRRAVNVVTLLPALHQLGAERQRGRQIVTKHVAVLAGQVVAAGIELLGVERGVIQPWHRAGYRDGATVG